MCELGNPSSGFMLLEHYQLILVGLGGAIAWTSHKLVKIKYEDKSKGQQCKGNANPKRGKHTGKSGEKIRYFTSLIC